MTGLVLVLLGAIASDPAFVRAERAFMRHDLAGAERAYREVLATDTVTRHRIQAAVTLANLAWRVRGDTAAANQWLRRAPSPRGGFAALRERALMRLANGDAAGARAAADSALAAATTAAEREEAAAVYGRSAIEPALTARLAGEPLTPAVRDAVRDATTRLSSTVEEAPGALEPARLLLVGAILTEQGAPALAGWRSYYLVAAGDSSSGLLAAPRRVLESLLPRLTPGNGSDDERLALIRAFSDSRVFEAAAALALTPAAGGRFPADLDAGAREIVVYARFLEDVERATDEFYRATLLGAPRPAQWRSRLIHRGARLWPRLAWKGQPPAYTAEALVDELDRRFGALVNLGETAGYQDLHYGHRVVDERRTVAQYGHEAAIRFVALDALVSNGFQSWAWNGRSAHGGWANSTTIVQIRPLYAEQPRRIWRELHDPVMQREMGARIAADSATDLVRARTTPVAYFPGAAARMERDGRQRLLDSLTAVGLTGSALQGAFTRELGHSTVESSIFAHEGRHAIDAADPALTSADREFRAKLSEVVFAPYPRLALGGILDANIGDGTPHGQANLRVVEGLLRWMTGHSRDIAGLDASAPLLPQLPLLTDDQLRAAFRSLDPFAG